MASRKPTADEASNIVRPWDDEPDDTRVLQEEIERTIAQRNMVGKPQGIRWDRRRLG